MLKDTKFKLGELLVQVGKITDDQLKEALKEQKTSGRKLGEILVERDFIKEEDIIEVLEFQLGIPHLNLDKFIIDPDIPRLITENLARRYVLIPVKKERGKLIVAMADPLNIFAIDDIKIATGYDVEPAIATKESILKSIDKHYGKQVAEKAVEDFKKQYEEENIKAITNEGLDDLSSAPMVRLVNSIINQAVNAKASDIHIEPFENNVRVRFRIDGCLQETMSLIKSTHISIVNRIKVLGKMDIAEKRLPQDGSLEVNIDGKSIDLRISILPTVFGEKIVIRILDRSGFFISKDELGLSNKNLEMFDDIIQNSNGIILITGPTGSGKTTTLYSILRELNSTDKNIITIEDPVEYRLDGINQVQVNNKSGLTFASGLRSILRQDPDIIMIGEIRDIETAEIAIRAAITGHLVISTVHTNDAPSTVARLIDMGIEPYLISSSLIGVIAQRLVRKICDRCREPYVPSEMEIKALGIDESTMIFKGRGCSYCFKTGYKGRVAIHEIMNINREQRVLINEKRNIDDLRVEAINKGMISLKENCSELVVNGITTFEELIRATYTGE